MMKVPLSFKDSEKDLYDFLKKHRNVSAYLKDLIEADMKKQEELNKPVRKRSIGL